MAVPSVEAVRLEVVGGKTLAYAVVVDEVGSLYEGLLMAWRDLEESVIEVDVVDCLNSVVSSRCRRLGVLKGLITRQRCNYLSGSHPAVAPVESGLRREGRSHLRGLLVGS